MCYQKKLFSPHFSQGNHSAITIQVQSINGHTGAVTSSVQTIHPGRQYLYLRIRVQVGLGIELNSQGFEVQFLTSSLNKWDDLLLLVLATYQRWAPKWNEHQWWTTIWNEHQWWAPKCNEHQWWAPTWNKHQWWAPKWSKNYILYLSSYSLLFGTSWLAFSSGTGQFHHMQSIQGMPSKWWEVYIFIVLWQSAIDTLTLHIWIVNIPWKEK